MAFFIDYLSKLKRDMIIKKLVKHKKELNKLFYKINGIKINLYGNTKFCCSNFTVNSKNSDHKILSVYTQPPKSNRGQKINVSAIHKYSNSENLSVRHPENLDRKEFEYLNNLKPDVVVVVAYGK